MFVKMLRKDIGKNKAITIILCLFVTLAAMLFAGAFSIISEMTGAMGEFYDKASPLHYMQMVTGMMDQRAIDDFSKNNHLVKAQQTLETLGIDNGKIYYGDNPEPYANSVMENSFVTQSPYFDFLLDENNRPVSVEPGQIAAPLYAMEAFGLQLGDSLSIKDGDFEMNFTVVCFVRDSQMNHSLVSSKRFVVSAEDYDRLKTHIGEVEYLIEFQLADLSKTGEFDSEYLAAGLPSGVAITFSMIQLMNAMTGGLAAVVLILAGFLLIVIALVCLRFTIVAALEEEYREIGVMKAIGLAPKQIGKLYKMKYYLLGAVSCVIGFMLSFVFSSLFTQSVTLYMGKAAASVWTLLLPLLGALAVFVIIVGSCAVVLRRLRKVSVVEAMRGNDSNGKQGGKAFPVYKSRFRNVNISIGARDVVNRLRSYVMPIFVFTLCAFLIVVPVNFLNTLQSPEFVGYTGIGYCDAVITLRYSDDIGERFAAVFEALAADKDVSAYAARVTANYKVLNLDGKYENISIQNGDFATFPVPYLHGRAPAADGEIALSLLNAQSFGKDIGDSIEIFADGKATDLTVCGIYQDLTNGGKSAQAQLPYQPEKVLWYAVSLSFLNDVDTASKIEGYSRMFAPVKVTDIEGYMSQTFASTIEQLKTVTGVVSVVSIAIAVLITALFIKMLLAKDSSQITIMKGLGFTSAHIRTQYLSAILLSLFLGLTLGMIAAGTLGEGLAGVLMSSMGASKISFVINPYISFIVCPVLLLTAVIATVMLSSRSIQKQNNYIVSE